MIRGRRQSADGLKSELRGMEFGEPIFDDGIPRQRSWRDVWSYAPVIDLKFKPCYRDLVLSDISQPSLFKDDAPAPIETTFVEHLNIWIPESEEIFAPTVWRKL